MTEQYIVGLY